MKCVFPFTRFTYYVQTSLTELEANLWIEPQVILGKDKNEDDIFCKKWIQFVYLVLLWKSLILNQLTWSVKNGPLVIN